jgi:anti-anti-sigma factor
MRDEPLTITATKGTNDWIGVLALKGPLTLPNIFAFQEKVAQLEPLLLIVDLTETPYMDSAGLGSVMNAYVHAKRNDRTVVLAGANERVKALLELTKVHLLLKNYASVAEAEAGVRPVCESNPEGA